MPTDWPLWLVLVLNVAGWPVIQFGLGWLFTRMPTEWFTPGAGYGWESGGRVYEQLFKIKSWKPRLPDAAPWFSGFAKGSLSNRDPAYLARFIQETWRGELCHWAALAFAPLFFLWNPWWGDAIMAAYALAANLPCILAQRYNRLRLQRMLPPAPLHRPQRLPQKRG